jgi:hypothetical protein
VSDNRVSSPAPSIDGESENETHEMLAVRTRILEDDVAYLTIDVGERNDKIKKLQSEKFRLGQQCEELQKANRALEKENRKLRRAFKRRLAE